MRKFIVTVNGVSYDVEVEEKDAASVQPAVKEQTRTAVQPAENKPAAVKPAAVSGAGNPVKAPLPGTVLEVRASKGQAVKAYDSGSHEDGKRDTGALRRHCFGNCRLKGCGGRHGRYFAVSCLRYSFNMNKTAF